MTDTPTPRQPKNQPRVASAVAVSAAMLSASIAGFYVVSRKNDTTSPAAATTTVAPATTLGPTQYTVGDVGVVTLNKDANDVITLSAAIPNTGWIVSSITQTSLNSIVVVFANMGSTVTFQATAASGVISTAVTQVSVATTTVRPATQWRPVTTTPRPSVTPTTVKSRPKPTTTTVKPTTTTIPSVTTTTEDRTHETSVTAQTTTTVRQRRDD
jgi:hypothetical protein